MRPGGVVVINKLGEDPLEVTPIADEDPVEALGPGGADEPLGEGIGLWSSYRSLDDASANRGHHLIKWTDELRVAISDEELDGRSSSSSTAARFRAC